MTRILFLVPTYNRSAFLGEALAAITAQMGDADQVLVIDDGSIDATPEVARSAGPRVRYIRQDNQGKSSALNRGLAETSGEFVWICDDDDILRPHAVAALTGALDDGAVDWAFARYTRFQDDGDGTRRDLGTGYWPDLSAGSLVRHILEDAFVMQNAALVRRSAYAAVGPFSTAMPRSLDYEMFVRLAVARPCAYVDTIAFDQRKHPGDRGPAAQRHAANSSEDVWRRFDSRIFANLYEYAPLSFFEAMYECSDGSVPRRAALLQRGAIMLRHDCMEQGLTDLAAAAGQSAAALDPGEAVICRHVLAGKNNPAMLWERGLAQSLRALSDGSRVGRQIVGEILAGMRWRLRRDPIGRWSSFRGMISAGGAVGAVHAMTRPALMHRAAGIAERDRLPPSALISPDDLRPVTER